MVDITPSIDQVKDQLHEAITREASIIRSLLTSLHDEHNAIVSCNEGMLDQVLEDRLHIFSSYEQWSEKLILLTVELAKEAEIVINDPSKLRHCEAIDLLQECLNPDDFELLSLKAQIEALINEVHHQNDINAHFLRENPRLLNYRKIHAMPLANPLEKKAKSIVAVIEE